MNAKFFWPSSAPRNIAQVAFPKLACLRRRERTARHGVAKTVPWKVQNVGRLPDKRAHDIAGLLAGDYHDLTGSEPTFSVAAGREDDGRHYGPFLDFVREIFQVLNIRRDALGYASTAAFKLRGRGRKK